MMKNNLKKIELKFEHDNKQLASILRNSADRIEHSNEPVTGIGLIVTFGNGGVATVYDATNLIHLLGGEGILRNRIIKEIENKY